MQVDTGADTTTGVAEPAKAANTAKVDTSPKAANGSKRSSRARVKATADPAAKEDWIQILQQTCKNALEAGIDLRYKTVERDGQTLVVIAVYGAAVCPECRNWSLGQCRNPECKLFQPEKATAQNVGPD